MPDGASSTLADGIQLTRVKEVAQRHDPSSQWAEVIISDGRNRAALISGPPGTPPDPHIHPDYNEWWISIGGTTQWQIGQYEPLLATFGDVVMAPAGYSHDIRPKGAGAALRLAVSHPNSNHDIRGVAPCRNVPIEYEMATPNLIHTRLDSVRQMHRADSPWSHVVVRDNRNLASVIQDLPGGEPQEEREAASDEWSVILDGTASLRTPGGPALDLEAGDIVLVEAGTRYRLNATGDAPSLRVMVSAPL